MAIDLDIPKAGERPRGIGPAGTAARAAVGGALLGSVVWGHATSGIDIPPWLIGLGVVPALTIAWQRWKARRHPSRLVWLSGPAGHATTFGVFMALYLTHWYAPPVSVLSDAAMIFYGSTMLVAAVRGYAGCEVLAISNWVLGRDDQIGCLLFEPIDRVEQRVAAETS
ncbi:MAG: hypothetical protein ACREA0_27630 [bacterium]